MSPAPAGRLPCGDERGGRRTGAGGRPDPPDRAHAARGGRRAVVRGRRRPDPPAVRVRAADGGGARPRGHVRGTAAGAAPRRRRADPAPIPGRHPPRFDAAGGGTGRRSARPGGAGAAPPPEVHLEVGDARAALAGQPAGRYDVVLADIYSGARMPAHVGTVEFVAEVARVLHPDGLYLVNLTDLPPLVFSRVQAATLGAVFAEVCLVAARRMLGGRRYGNVVLAAAVRPGRLPVRKLATRVTRDAVPGTVLHGPALADFVAGAAPATDAVPPTT
nr:fused MFS/spermidine synthase [Micromonospora pallida]